MRTIRTLTASETETLLRWAAEEGWNPGPADAAAFYAADPGGFLGAFVADRLVAGISAVAYGRTFGFIGLYICHPDHRGQGHGRAVWDAGMARLAGRTIGLDGVPAQQDNYARMGFVKAGETIRFTGKPPPISDGRLLAVSPSLRSAVDALDGRCFPADRAAFRDAWLAPPRRALALVEGGRLRGYGVIRPCREGDKIGPLFADKTTTAEALCCGLGALAPGPVSIDAPAGKQRFIASLTAAGFSAGFSTARMYRGPAPAIDTGSVFGITTLELG